MAALTDSSFGCIGFASAALLLEYYIAAQLDRFFVLIFSSLPCVVVLQASEVHRTARMHGRENDEVIDVDVAKDGVLNLQCTSQLSASRKLLMWHILLM